jgi:hypothetical protein
MKKLSQYLAESAKTYEFRMKTICKLSDDQLDCMERCLRKYEAYDISSPKKTIMQRNPIDFHDSGAHEVFIIDFKTKLPTAPHELMNMLVAKLGCAENTIKVRNSADPIEELDEKSREAPDSKKYSVRLTDGDYSEYDAQKADEMHGEKHITSFIKELEKSRVDLTTEYKVKNNDK